MVGKKWTKGLEIAYEEYQSSLDENKKVQDHPFLQKVEKELRFLKLRDRMLAKRISSKIF